MSCSMMDPLSRAIHFLLGLVCKPSIRPQQRLSMCVHRRLTFVAEMHTRRGGILQAQLGGKLRLFFSGGLRMYCAVSQFI